MSRMPQSSGRTLFLLEEGVCWSLMTHRSSSRKRCFVLEGESKVLSVQAAAFRRNIQGTENLMLLSVLSLVVVDWRKGLPGKAG